MKTKKKKKNAVIRWDFLLGQKKKKLCCVKNCCRHPDRATRRGYGDDAADAVCCDVD